MVKNGWAVRILTTLMAALLVAAILGGFTLAREVSAMGATIEALTAQVIDSFEARGITDKQAMLAALEAKFGDTI